MLPGSLHPSEHSSRAAGVAPSHEPCQETRQLWKHRVVLGPSRSRDHGTGAGQAPQAAGGASCCFLRRSQGSGAATAPFRPHHPTEPRRICLCRHPPVLLGTGLAAGFRAELPLSHPCTGAAAVPAGTGGPEEDVPHQQTPYKIRKGRRTSQASTSHPKGGTWGSATAISPVQVGTELILPFLSREWAPAYLPGSWKEHSQELQFSILTSITVPGMCSLVTPGFQPSVGAELMIPFLVCHIVVTGGSVRALNLIKYTVHFLKCVLEV